MSNDRPEGAFAALDLGNIEDRTTVRRLPSAHQIDRRSTLPVREAQPEKEGYDQINIKAPISQAKRFRALAKDHRSQAKLLEKMMDLWERQSR